jgi:hypothetical protein
MDSITQRVETVGGGFVSINTPGEKGVGIDKDQTDMVMRKDENGRSWMHTGDEAR